MSAPTSELHDSSWLRREAALERFEAAWREAGDADIAAYLPMEGSADRRAFLLQLAKIDLELRWEKGERLRPEDYVARFPELADLEGPPIELIATEIEVRLHLGCAPSVEELAARFPGRADDLASETNRTLPIDAPLSAIAYTLLSNKSAPIITSIRTPKSKPELTSCLGQYELRGVVGRGSFAAVYRAWDTKLCREVALKLPHEHILESQDVRNRLHREALSAARLRHPAIVSLFEVGEAAGRPFLVYEFVSGPTLATALRESTPPPDQAAAWVARLAEALDYAHRLGVVHRDVKPSNVMIDGNGQPMLADFGLALVTDAHTVLTQEGDVLGTPAYMPPEQAAGHLADVGPQSDVYSLGALLYELLCGHPPFQGNLTSILDGVLHDEPPAPSRRRAGVPSDLETVCLKAMSKEPERRYATAAALADDLHRYLERRPVLARRTRLLGHMALWCRRKPALAGTVALAGLIIAVVAGVSSWRVLEERDRFRAERDRAQENLYQSLVSSAQAQVRSRDTGWWWRAIDDIRAAAALDVRSRDRTALRELAIQCLGSQYPSLRLHREWEGHSSAVIDIAFSPGDRLIASASKDQTIRLWHSPSGRLVAILEGHKATVTSVAFHPTRPILVSASADGTLRSWNIKGVGGEQAASPGSDVIELGGGFIRAAAISPDGNWIASACGDGTVRVIATPSQGQPPTGRLMPDIRIWRGHTEAVTCLQFSPDSKKLGSGGLDRTVRFWDVPSGKPLSAWPTHPPTSLAWMGDGSPGDVIGIADSETFGMNFRTADQGSFNGRVQLHAGIVHQLRFVWNARALTASADGTLKLWDIRKWDELAVAQGEYPAVLTMSCSSNEQMVVSGYADGHIRLWDFTYPTQRTLVPTDCPSAVFVGEGHRLVNGRLVADITQGDPGSTRGYASGPVVGLVVHPDGSRIALSRNEGTLEIWDRTRGAELARWNAHERRIQCIAGNPDGTLIATASDADPIRLWDWSTGNRIGELPSPVGAVDSLIWEPTGRSLVVCGQHGAAVVQAAGKADSATPLPHIRPHTPVACGRGMLAYPNADNAIEILSLDSSKVIHTLRGHQAQVTALAFAPDSRALASAAPDGTVRLWRLDTEKELSVLRMDTASPKWLAFDAQGKYLAYGGQRASAHVWTLKPKTASAWIKLGPAHSGSFLPDGSSLLLGLETGAVMQCRMADISQALSGITQNETSGASEPVRVETTTVVVEGGHADSSFGVWGMAASPDGHWFATASEDTTVKLWDAKTSRVVRTFKGHKAPVWCVSFSPDGRLIAGAGVGVKVWETATGRLCHEFQDHERMVSSVAIHPSGRWLASCSYDGSVHLRELPSGRDLGLLHKFDTQLHNLTFDPSGSWLAVACHDFKVALWACVEQPPKPAPPGNSLSGHPGPVRAVRFSADGRHFASGSEGGTIVLWDGQTFSRIARLKGGTGQIRSLDFSQDGRYLAGAAYVSPTIVWDLPSVRSALRAMDLDW